MENIKKILKEIRSCKKCDPQSDPLVFEPKEQNISIIVISEAPGRLWGGPSEEPQEQMWRSLWMKLPRSDKQNLWKKGILSFANPIYRYLQGLFNGKFDPSSTAYWTHYAKCFHEPLKDACSEAFLVREIEAIRPKLIIAIGAKSANFISQYTPQIPSKLRYEGKLRVVAKMQRFPTVQLPGLPAKPKLALLPHPSKANRVMWNRVGKIIASLVVPRLKRKIRRILRDQGKLR